MRKIGSKELIREINVSQILRLINERGKISRTELSKETGLSLAAICNIIDSLIKKGFVSEVGVGESSGGRKPVLLSINKKAYYVIGIKVGAEEITFVLTGIDSNPVEKLVYKTPSSLSLEEVTDAISKGVSNLLSLTSINKKCLLGIGIGISGLVNSESGFVVKSGILGWQDIPLKKLLEKRLKINVYIDNDVNTLAIAEKLFGIAQKYENFVLVTIGRGVGAGIFIKGELYRGAIGGAGEFGHIVVDPNGLLCECGNRGCLETFIADPFIVERVKTKLKKGEKSIITNLIDNLDEITPQIILEAANLGDEFSKEIFKEIGNHLGRGLSILVNILNPELIILSGEGMRAQEFIMESTIKSLKSHTFANMGEKLEVIPLRLGDDSWAVGAAALAINKIFEVK